MGHVSCATIEIKTQTLVYKSIYSESATSCLLHFDISCCWLFLCNKGVATLGINNLFTK